MAETAQPTPDTDKKKSHGFTHYVVWAFVAVIVYALSSGPAARFEIKTGASHPVLDTIYAPLAGTIQTKPSF